MNRRPIAFVMEQTLGSITHYLNLRREESAAEGISPRWLPIEFGPGRLPWAIRGSLLARRALASVLDEVAGCFVHTTSLSLLAAGHFRRKPAIVSSDGTPLNKRDMRGAYGLAAESGLAAQAKRALYRRVFTRAAGFVAWSSWTKASLVEDYGCRAEDVVVIPPGVDLASFAPGPRANERPRILFVGGDFERKGGSLLLDVFRKRLRGRAELDLVTQAEVPEEPGVRVHKGIAPNSEALRALYAKSDLFALPTRADCYPLVGMEALAAGLPLVVTRVGGLPDLVREGVTGHVIGRDDEAALGDALEALVADAQRRRRMAQACREDARERFEVRTNARRLFEFVRSRC